jgi:hypothetical protein
MIAPSASGPPPEPFAALGPGQLHRFLDELICAEVMACIDFDELYHLEQSLALLATELDDMGPDRAADLAKDLLDRALRRAPDELHRHVRPATSIRS